MSVQRRLATKAVTHADNRWAPRLLLLGFFCAALGIHAAWMRSLFLGHCPDDAYISFRYADNLAHSRGLVFNPGERVEGYSNLLWVLLLAPFARVFDDLTMPAQYLGALLGLLTMLLAALLQWRSAECRAWPPRALTAALIVSSGYYAAWIVGGLETSLHALLLLAVWWRMCAEAEDSARLPLSAFLLLLLMLARPEGIAIAAILASLRIASCVRRRTWSRMDGLFLSVVFLGALAFEAWRWNYYGPHLFGTAVRAKTAASAPAAVRGLKYIGSYLFWPYAPVLAVAVWSSFASRSARIALVIVGLHVGVLTLAGGDWAKGRLLAPIIPLLATVAGQWFGGAASRLSEKKQIVLNVGAGLFVVFCFLVTSLQREAPWRRYFAPKDAERITVGKWIAAQTPQQLRIAVFAAGQVPYYSKRYSHDMLGLNDAHIADLRMPGMGRGTAGHEKFDVDYTLGTVRPDLIVDGRSIPDMRKDSRFQHNYVRIPNWTLTDVRIRKDLLAGSPDSVSTPQDGGGDR